MKSDTMVFIVWGVMILALILELRNANMLVESYREAAHRATAIGEACAEQLETQVEWPAYPDDRQSL